MKKTSDNQTIFLKWIQGVAALIALLANEISALEDRIRVIEQKGRNN